MKDQFNGMKSTFLKKITDLTEDISKLKSDSRRKIMSIEEDFKKATYLKDVFLRQITEYQKIYNI